MAPTCCLLALQASHWTARYFPHIQLHRGDPAVTVQVAWQQPERVSTDARMPCAVSIFDANHKLLSSTYILAAGYGIQSDSPPVCEQDRVSGEALLALTVNLEGTCQTAVYSFKGIRPALAIAEFSVRADDLRNGRILEWALAKDAGIKMPANHHPNPPMERVLRFEPTSRKFVPVTKWKETIFNLPASATRTGSSDGHTFRISVATRNFVLGDRAMTLKPGKGLYLDGLETHGADASTEDMKSEERKRAMFMTEPTRFDVWIDSKRIHVPRSIWCTCMDLHLESIRAELIRNGSALRISIGGSDGDGGYEAIWTINRNGRCSRSFVALA